MMSTDEMAGPLTGPIPAQVAGVNVGSSGGRQWPTSSRMRSAAISVFLVQEIYQ